MTGSRKVRSEGGSESVESSTWVDKEGAASSFNDTRLDRRFSTLLHQLTDGVGQSIPFSCQDWANTKAAYRFISNPKVNEVDIFSGHFKSTRERLVRTDGPVLVLHDTTEFSYKRDDTSAIGITCRLTK